MKPKPFSALNHFTVPLAMLSSPVCLVPGNRRVAGAAQMLSGQHSVPQSVYGAINTRRRRADGQAFATGRRIRRAIEATATTSWLHLGSSTSASPGRRPADRRSLCATFAPPSTARRARGPPPRLRGRRSRRSSRAKSVAPGLAREHGVGRPARPTIWSFTWVASPSSGVALSTSDASHDGVDGRPCSSGAGVAVGEGVGNSTTRPEATSKVAEDADARRGRPVARAAHSEDDPAAPRRASARWAPTRPAGRRADRRSDRGGVRHGMMSVFRVGHRSVGPNERAALARARASRSRRQPPDEHGRVAVRQVVSRSGRAAASSARS